MKTKNKTKLKCQYFEKLNYLFSKYSRILLVDITNVGSNQIQKCRKALSLNSIMVIGKNTLIRKVIKLHIKNKENLELFSSSVSGNIGIIFSDTEPFEIREILRANKVPAAAKPGQMSQCDVVIPSGLTDLPPEATSFFQALNIQTKIQKGQIEIINPVNLLKKGQLIGNSESVLLQKLSITPFSFEIKIKQIFDCNCIYDTTLLDIKPENITETIQNKIHELDLISIATEYPTAFYLKNSTEKILGYLYYLAKFFNYEIKNQTNQIELLKKIVIENEKITEIQIENKNNNDTTTRYEKEISEDMGLNLFD